MKKHLKMLPVMIYPYIYMVCLILVFLLGGVVGSDLVNEYGVLILLGIGVIVNLYSVVIVIAYLVQAIRGKLDSREMTALTMIIKLVQIPAYVIHFAIGLVGMVLSIWGIGFIIWAILIDILTIFLTGLVGTSAGISCCKDKVLSKGGATLYSFLCFIYCIDVIASIVYFFKVRKAHKLGMADTNF